MNPEEEEFAAAAAAHISAHDRLGGREESAEAHLTRAFSLRGGERGGAQAGMVLRVRELSTALPAAAGHDLGSGGGDMAFSGVHTWPSAVALGELALSSERSLRGRRVVEVGAGTGVPSLAAAAWAAEVVVTDRAQVRRDAPLPADSFFIPPSLVYQSTMLSYPPYSLLRSRCDGTDNAPDSTQTEEGL